jgi:hypothetical protein
MRAFEIGQQSCLIEKAVGAILRGALSAAAILVANPLTAGAGAEAKMASANETQAGSLGISTCNSGLCRPDWRVIQPWRDDWLGSGPNILNRAFCSSVNDA